eukprot:TRINITY_DN3160_c0_g1_i1.p1 TRINITY_DN3160_c0_g1~~TRINITY_DN3160_c0_g1_i1.p1  ORF type:complete len:539 (+),score=125.53 TRINITY_DN3160_c0_g1_i1:85-1701(+)
MESFLAPFKEMLVRPPRAYYTKRELGPNKFSIGGKKYIRKDFKIKNERGHELVCSHYKLDKTSNMGEETTSEDEKPPIVVYSHGNAGCRLACFDEVPFCLHYGMELFSYDFSGCGRSDGEKISLGYFEKSDLSACVNYLVKEKYSRIGLWGRSMGAATTILYASETTLENIKCMVVDSPFTSIYDIAMYLATNQIQIRIPKFLLGFFAKIGIGKLKSMILKEENFDIYKVNPLKSISSCKIPAIFFAGKADTLVPPSHSAQLCDVLKKNNVDAHLYNFYGGHNELRQVESWEGAARHFYKYLFTDSMKKKFENDLLPIPYKSLPQEHRSWIVRRIIPMRRSDQDEDDEITVSENEETKKKDPKLEKILLKEKKEENLNPPNDNVFENPIKRLQILVVGPQYIQIRHAFNGQIETEYRFNELRSYQEVDTCLLALRFKDQLQYIFHFVECSVAIEFITNTIDEILDNEKNEPIEDRIRISIENIIDNMKKNGEKINENKLVGDLERVIFENMLSEEKDNPTERERLHNFIVSEVHKYFV